MIKRLKQCIVLVLFLSTTLTYAQQGTISGRVTDQMGESLPGVSILIKGTDIGTATDNDGQFKLTQVSKESVLVVSFIGMMTQEIVVGSKTNLKIVMETSYIGIDEVVAIGYGTAKKADLMGAVTSVSTSDFDKMPATSPLLSIQGRASGIQITSNSGMPGAGANVSIRGVQSINGSNAPIFVVDGVITSNIDNLNPNNIESVSVLKDASASAIYGARAANGVVLVTTKRGNAQQEPKITLNAYYGVQTEGNLKLKQLNSSQFLELWTESYTNAGLKVPWDDQKLEYYKGVDTDWRDLMLQTGTIQSYDLSVAGGSEKSNYFISAGYLNQKGMIIETGYEKYTVNFNSDHKIGERIKFGNSLNLYSSKQLGSERAYQYALRKSPLTRAYEENGDYGKIYDSNLEHIHASPVWLAKNESYESKTKGLQGNMYLTFKILEGLDVTARGSMDYSNSFDSEFLSGVPPQYGWEGSNINNVNKYTDETVHWIGDFLLNYEKTINENHDIKVLLGYSAEESTWESLYGSRSGTPNNDIRYLDAGDPSTAINNNDFVDWAFTSIFGRVNYSFKNKFLFNATVRRDGSSRLVNDNIYGVFPSGSVAWRISEENFMSNVNFIDDMKIRASVGTLGNILSIHPYDIKPKLTARLAAINNSGAQAYTVTDAVDTDLRWESATKKNLGIDAYMFKSKLYTTINFFIEDTYDLLFQDRLASSAGYVNSPFINGGEVQNIGYELELGYREKKGDWSYDVALNLSAVNNEVTELNGRDLRTSGLQEGYPVRSHYGYKSNGLIKTAEQLKKYEGGTFKTKQIGDIDLMDIDGYDENGNLTGKPDGKVDAADRTIIGTKYPNLVYGGTGSLSYKNWTMQMTFQGVQGVDIRTRVSGNNDLVQLMSSWARNEDARVLDRYDATNNPNGTWPRLSKNQSGLNGEFSDFWLQDASYLRVKNLNLNYTVPETYCQRIGMGSLGLYVSVQNVYTFTKFDGPEVDTSASDALTGIPQPRTWTLGLKATF